MENKAQKNVKLVDALALALVIIGALDWGVWGIFQRDFVSLLFGGPSAVWSRGVYILVALAGLWSIRLLIRAWQASGSVSQA
ncbi:DUF378 domain-containing protein [Candidatus Methylacidithermus pantelleriae]|uniref:DUF378 domain-containing protein n=1 Tax=Candidatus Methylacidithermus pantelleriae TaxID=2744239 RepID=A0A8J2BSS8_9BACT|nr:DUF378 domain-containing protein [Candidatus Methylacidithermus pantelleriae]CAF0696002.1 hypothetical protein MPNT_20083 [Candidatus Methylacidithermus pantelleriae]